MSEQDENDGVCRHEWALVRSGPRQRAKSTFHAATPESTPAPMMRRCKLCGAEEPPTFGNGA